MAEYQQYRVGRTQVYIISLCVMVKLLSLITVGVITQALTIFLIEEPGNVLYSTLHQNINNTVIALLEQIGTACFNSIDVCTHKIRTK